MLAEERRNLILEKLYADGQVRTGELVGHFDVSEVTLRSDLVELERRGRVVRTRGGAVMSTTEVERPNFATRTMLNKTTKLRIGGAAARMLRSHQTVLMDAGTTVLSMAQQLPEVSDITVLTPGLNTAEHLLRVSGVEVVLLGGALDPAHLCTAALMPMAADEQAVAHISFAGAHGIDADLDIIEVSQQTAAVKRRVLAGARRVVLLADSSKWNIEGAAKVAPLRQVDVVITDDGLDERTARRILDAGIELIRV